VKAEGEAMKLLTIGEFARAARLSPKALRLYDSLGLLRPARVDEWSGYRYYAPDQLDQARLVAWLRRLGMPLARIKEISGSPSDEVAAKVAAFLRVAEDDLAERKRLAQFLISYFTEGTTAMSDSAISTSTSTLSTPTPPLAISYASASDIGRARDRNQDAGYAGPRLLAVADGFGPAGDAASAAVLDALRPLESTPPPTGAPADLLNVLSDAVSAATASVRSLTESDPELAGTGSTLTAMLLSGSRLALVHIGDTRAYLLRDGGLFQITHDHSLVQSMIDTGRLTPEEAVSHPQRSLLLRAIATAEPDSNAGGSSGTDAQTPDLSLHDARPGDRYLLCSDGLTSVVPVAAIRETLREPELSPADVVSRLIALANEAGGPDNIACAIADITEAA
jgi:serine/threonine protein phosphatase PrpC/DNA-binding transcriptional MerR regulator